MVVLVPWAGRPWRDPFEMTFWQRPSEGLAKGMEEGLKNGSLREGNFGRPSGEGP
jgi:hypothetical protein